MTYNQSHSDLTSGIAAQRSMAELRSAGLRIHSCTFNASISTPDNDDDREEFHSLYWIAYHSQPRGLTGRVLQARPETKKSRIALGGLPPPPQTPEVLAKYGPS